MPATIPLHLQYQDTNGSPLDGGYLYFGTENQNAITNPITVYWDADLTIPAAQPIRTINGFPSRNGNISNVYCSVNYSLIVKNSNLETVYSELSSENSFFGTSWFIQDGAGAVLRTSQSKMRDIVSAKDFGAVGDGVTDDFDAIQSAVDAVGALGGFVDLPGGHYMSSGTITLPSGVMLRGVGTGKKVGIASPRGTTIQYTGATTAVVFDGPHTGMKDILLRGSSTALGGGIKLNANGGNQIESWIIDNVAIYGFTGGIGLDFNALDGGISYGCASNLRIRHAKIGIRFYDRTRTGGGGLGFANSNTFYSGSISGGGFDYCIYCDGGSDNKFYGMVMEPSSETTYNLIGMDAGYITFDGRIEALAQGLVKPTVYVSSIARIKLYNFYGGGFIDDRSSNSEISARNSLVLHPSKITANTLVNPTFAGADPAAFTIPYWILSYTGTAPTLEVLAPELRDNAYVLKFTLPAGTRFTFRPSTAPTGASCSIGAYIKTTEAGKAQAYIAAPNLAPSFPHPGDGLWHPVGMFRSSITGAIDARFLMDNSSGVSAAIFYLTVPHVSNGEGVQEIQPLTANGGVVTGTLSTIKTNIPLPAAGDDFFYTTATEELTIPKWGNIFHVTGTARTITRLNNVSANRFVEGTQIRLIFDIGGVVVTDGSYINLTAAFTSAVPADTAGRSWLLLEATSSGTWAEIDRRA